MTSAALTDILRARSAAMVLRTVMSRINGSDGIACALAIVVMLLPRTFANASPSCEAVLAPGVSPPSSCLAPRDVPAMRWSCPLGLVFLDVARLRRGRCSVPWVAFVSPGFRRPRAYSSILACLPTAAGRPPPQRQSCLSLLRDARVRSALAFSSFRLTRTPGYGLPAVLPPGGSRSAPTRRLAGHRPRLLFRSLGLEFDRT